MLSLFLALNLILILNLEPNIEKTMFASSRLGVVKFLYGPLFVTSLIIVPRYLTKGGGQQDMLVGGRSNEWQLSAHILLGPRSRESERR